MENISFEIFSYPEGQRIWLIRASSGKHLGNFIKHGVVAISHIDKAIIKEGVSELPKASDIKSLIYKHYSEDSNPAPTEELLDDELDESGFIPVSEEENPEKNTSLESRIHQVFSFIEKIKKGDMILSLDKESIAIGICKSDAYLRSDQLRLTKTLAGGKQKVEILDYRLRRDVAWLDPIPRQLAGSTLRKPLLARKTISNLDDYWDKVYSLAFPVFTKGRSIYISNRIRSTNRVGTRSVSRLLDYVADTQLIADAIFKGEFNEKFLENLAGSNGLSLSERSVSQAEFMSPGNIYHAIESLAGVDPKDYAKAILISLLVGLGGCSGEESSMTISEQLSHLINQRDMTDERTDSISSNAKSDAMLKKLEEYSKSKEVDKIAKGLDISIGISETAKTGGLSLPRSTEPYPIQGAESTKQSEIKEQIDLDL